MRTNNKIRCICKRALTIHDDDDDYDDNNDDDDSDEDVWFTQLYDLGYYTS